MTTEQRIKELEQMGELSPTCKMCQAEFYLALREGKEFSTIFAPRHLASNRCESGKNPHCTCDRCF